MNLLSSTFRLLALLLATATLHAQLPAGSQDAAATDSRTTQRAIANDALDRQDFPRALKILTPLAEQNPGDARLLYDLAYTQDALDQTTTAETTYHAAIAADPTLIEPHLGLGLLLARTNHPAEAHTELTAAAALPTDAHALKARAYRALARLDLKSSPDAARDELLEALKLTPETPDDTLMAAELAESAKDPDAAEKAYRSSLSRTPNDPATTAALAHLLTPTKPAEAEALLNAALTAHAGDTALTAQLAALYAAQNKYAAAIPLAETLHTANPQDANLTRLLADLYSQSGTPEKADPLFVTLIAARPTATLLDDRASNLIKLHRYAEAENLLQKSVAAGAVAFPAKEDFGIAASHLAFAASNNGDPQTVLRAVALRATVLPPSPAAMFLSATAYDKLHDFKQAADLYKQFLAAAGEKFPDEEFEARHRLLAIQNRK